MLPSPGKPLVSLLAFIRLSAMKGKRQLSRQLVKQLRPPTQGAKPRDAVQNLPKH